MRVNIDVQGIERVVAEVESRIHKTARVLVLEIWNNLVENTPVRSGRARANWVISRTGVAAELPPGQYSYPAPPVVPRFKELFIVNPLDYVQYLNDGWSEQAPAGFIEASVFNAEETIRRTKRLR